MMIYQIYSKNGLYLIILPELAAWTILDSFAKDVFEQLALRKTIDEVAEMKFGSPEEVREVYESLSEFVDNRCDAKFSDVGSNNLLDKNSAVAVVGLTAKCNLRCRHCYIAAGNSAPREMSTSDHCLVAKKITGYLKGKSINSNTVNLTGGEPFILPDIGRIISAYRENGIDVVVSSNGLLINKEHIEMLKDNNIYVVVSLDGSRSSIHEFVRGEDTWDKTVRNIAKLTESGVRVGVNFMMHGQNFQDIGNTIDLAIKLGCSSFNPMNLVRMGRAVESGLTPAEESVVFAELAKLVLEDPNRLRILSHTSLFTSLGASLLSGIKCECCGIGDSPYIFVSETGDIYPCPNARDKAFGLGNILTSEIENCINPKRWIFKTLRSAKVDSIDWCKECDVRYFCGGDCRGETYRVSGSLFAPYVNCRDRHDSIIELMWIAAEHPEIFSGRSSDFATIARGI